MNVEKKYFSVSPDTKFWEKGKPILLGGKWCIDLEKDNTKNFNVSVLKNNFFEINASENEVDFCNNLYEELLPELSKKLNTTHELKWPVRSWRVMIGPWLNRYIAVINNRLNILQEAKKDFDINFKKINFKDESLVSKNIVDFSNKSVSEEWNEKLVRRLNLFYDKKVAKDYFYNFIPQKFDKKNQSLKEKLVNFFGFRINYLVSKFFVKKNNFVFNKIYLEDFSTTFKLFLRLRQFPSNFFFNENIPSEQFNSEKRKNFIFEVENPMNSKEKIIKLLIPEMIPIIYIEGFQNYKKIVNSHNLPKKKLYIFTCNAWNDTIFKFWISEKINSGSKLIYGQHGAGNGLVRKIFGDTHDRAISDKFISWGQEYKLNQNNIPGLVQSVIKNKKKSYFNTEQKNILIISTVNDIYLYRNEVKNPNLLADDLFYLNTFLANLLKNFKDKLIFKIHPKEYKKSFSYQRYFEKKLNNLKIISHQNDLEYLMKKSKLSVFLYLGSDFLKNLSISRPSIAVLPKQIVHMLTPETIKIFERLNRANVIFFNFKDAEEFIIKKHDNIGNWWSDRHTQSEIKKFTDIYARNPKNPLDQLTKILNECKKIVDKN